MILQLKGSPQPGAGVTSLGLPSLLPPTLQLQSPRLQTPFNHLVVLFRLSPNLKESVVSSAATPLTALERFQGEGTSPICILPHSKQRTVEFTNFRFPQPDLWPTDSTSRHLDLSRSLGD